MEILYELWIESFQVMPLYMWPLVLIVALFGTFCFIMVCIVLPGMFLTMFCVGIIELCNRCIKLLSNKLSYERYTSLETRNNNF